MLSRAAADIEEAGALVMAVMDAPVQRRLEALADAGNQKRIADQVEWFGCWISLGMLSLPHLPPAA